MDLNMPHVTGIQATRLIRERFPAVHGLALTTYDADEWVLPAVRARRGRPGPGGGDRPAPRAGGLAEAPSGEAG